MTTPAAPILIPAPQATKRLATLGQVRREMSTVYRDAREGTIPTSDASRLVYVLGQIAGVIEGERIESRIIALEKQVNI